MSYVLFRHVFGLMFGIILGLIFPALASWWLLLVLLGVLIANELTGQWGFDNRWYDYRGVSYILYSGTAASVLLGIFFGSGKFGTLLVTIGTLISR